MIAFIIYLIKVSIITGFFYLFYILLLRNEVFFRFNRFYLLSSVFIALLIPCLNIPVNTGTGITLVPQITPDYWFDELNYRFDSQVTIEHNRIDLKLLISIVYIIITFLFLVRACIHFLRLYLGICKSKGIRAGGVVIKYSENDESPFSFFNYIIIHRGSSVRHHMKDILHHELVHVKQFHSADKLIMELFAILLWFNPFIYQYRKLLTEVHEYLADRGAIAGSKVFGAYQSLLLNWVSGGPDHYFANRLTNSLIKKRIIMLSKIKSKRKNFKILLITPLLGILMVIFGFDLKTEIQLSPGNNLFLQQIVQSDSSDNIPAGMPFKEGVEVRIASGYGMRIHPIEKKEMMHYGIDLVAPKGTPVITTADGIVEKAEFAEGYGNIVLVKHNDVYATFYTQLLKFDVEPGQKVHKGEVLGYLGESGLSTGPHLHYEVHKNGERVDPADYL